MKKFLTIAIVLSILFISSGCMNKKVDDTDINDNDEVEMFDGEINIFWNDVKNDYEKIEVESEREAENMDNVDYKYIKNLENNIETNYAEIKDGIDNNNEESAKEIYKSASLIEQLNKKDNVNINDELLTLSNNSKKLVKHYYGEADEDFTTVKNNFEKGIENIKNYTEDKWQEFVDMIK